MCYFFPPEEEASNQHEINSIDDKLKQLGEQKAELQKTYDAALGTKENGNSIKRESRRYCSESLLNHTLAL